MYYITDEQIDMFLQSVKRLPVKASGDFATADAWVGLYLAIDRVRQQKLPEKAEVPAEEADKEE